jgi:hypothetical protein
MMTVLSVSVVARRTASSARPLVRGYRPTGRVVRGRVSSARTMGRPSASTASVLTCTKRRAPPACAAPSMFSVPTTLMRWNSAGSPQSVTVAAE